MSYIDQTLLTNETVQYRAAVHWWTFIGPLTLLIPGLILRGFSPSFFSILGYILIGLGIFGLINLYIERRFAEFVVTNKRVVLIDRKSRRLNSRHANISYAVFC